MKALCICGDLRRAVKEGRITGGKVHSVFRNACNIECGGDIVTLLDKAKPMPPMGVLLSGGKTGLDFQAAGIAPGMRFSFKPQVIACGDMDIRISLAGLPEWYSDIEENAEGVHEAEVLRNLAALEEALYICGRFEGAGQILGTLKGKFPGLGLFEPVIVPDRHFEFIRKSSVAFMRALTDCNLEATAGEAMRIVGFGPGLTPAADDFIGGIMISLVYMGRFYGLDTGKIASLNQKITEGCMEKTTRVSAEMLKHAANGRANQSVKELMRSLLCQKRGEAVRRAAAAAMGCGETSGTDTVLGIHTGIKIALEWNKKEIENGFIG